MKACKGNPERSDHGGGPVYADRRASAAVEGELGEAYRLVLADHRRRLRRLKVAIQALEAVEAHHGPVTSPGSGAPR